MYAIIFLCWCLLFRSQDWLITVFRGVDAAQSNVTAADIWLGAMDEAAANLGVTVQCEKLDKGRLWEWVGCQYCVLLWHSVSKLSR